MGPLLRTLFGLSLGWAVSRLLGFLGHFRASKLATRRTFLRNAALGASGAVLTLIGGGTLALLWPNKTGAFGRELSVNAADVPGPMEPPLLNTQGKFFLVHNEQGLMALYTKCPHLGCTVPWVGPADSPTAFQCPCHGSMYDYNGERTGGPAPRPMDMMRVTVDGDAILVDTGEIIERAAYSPDQAVPFQA